VPRKTIETSRPQRNGFTTPNNPDGSVDVLFGPQAREGKDSHRFTTHAAGRFELLFRLYGSEKPLSDKTWQLPDFRKCIEMSAPVSSGSFRWPFVTDSSWLTPAL
jgi:hypothetical protein